MATTVTAQAVLDAYRGAWESKNWSALADCYADDAVVVSYSERNRPSSVEEIRGREAIAAHFSAEPEGLKHVLTDAVAGENGFAFTMKCSYPTGELVMWTATCEVSDGEIVRQVGVEAWDE